MQLIIYFIFHVMIRQPFKISYRNLNFCQSFLPDWTGTISLLVHTLAAVSAAMTSKIDLQPRMFDKN